MGRLPSTQSPSPLLYIRATFLCLQQGSHVGIHFCWGYIFVIFYVLLCNPITVLGWLTKRFLCACLWTRDRIEQGTRKTR